MSKVEYNQSGYIGSSMSVRAKEAYDNGEMPKSKWTKGAMLYAIEEWCDYNDRIYDPNIEKMTKKELFKKFFHYSSWHHTSKYANPTDFYSLNENALNELTEYAKERHIDWLTALQKMKEDFEEERQRQIKLYEEEQVFIEKHGFSPTSTEALKSIAPYLVSNKRKVKRLTGFSGTEFVEIDCVDVETPYGKIWIDDWRKSLKSETNFNLLDLTPEWKTFLEEKQKEIEQNNERER